jgi:hypothetical protein
MKGDTLNEIGMIAISGATKKRRPQHKKINMHNSKFFVLVLRNLVMPYLS